MDLKMIAGAVVAILLGYGALYVLVFVFLMRHYHQPLATAQRNATSLLFRLPLFVAILAAAGYLVQQLFKA